MNHYACFSRWVKRTGGAFALIAAFAVAVWAGPLEDANERYQSGDYRGALTLLQQARQEQPNNAQVYVGLGKTYRRLGDNAQALQAYREIFRVDPDLQNIKDKQGFLKVFRELGGQVPQKGANGNRGASNNAQTQAGDVITALNSQKYFIVPGLRDTVDPKPLQNAIAASRPTDIRIAVLGGLRAVCVARSLSGRFAKTAELATGRGSDCGDPAGRECLI